MTRSTEEPTMRHYEFTDRMGNTITTDAYLLGAGSSQERHHSGHADQEYAPRGQRCSACRWFEVIILDTVDDDHAEADYLVYTCGKTIVPGDRNRHNVTWTDSPEAIIELLTVRPRDGEPHLPGTSARALAEAAHHDDAIRDAYKNRAVK